MEMFAVCTYCRKEITDFAASVIVKDFKLAHANCVGENK